MVKVLDLVLDVSTKWFELGLQLGVKESELERIEHDHGQRDAQACLRKMLSVWLRMITPHPSWERLLTSLSHPSVGDPALAEKIREEVGIPQQSLTIVGSGRFPILRMYVGHKYYVF